MATWYDTHITQGFFWGWNPGKTGGQHGTTNGHPGIDLAEANGTPLTTPVAGTVVWAKAMKWGGQVSILFDAGGGKQMILTCLHLSDIAVQQGQQLVAGQLVGKTGGASWSSPIPTLCCSTGPHLHFELDNSTQPPYVGKGSPYSPGGWGYPVDPTNFFYAIKATGIANDQSALGLGSSTYDASLAQQQAQNGDSSDGPPHPWPGEQAHAALTDLPGFAGIVLALDRAESFVGYHPPSAPADPSVGIGPAQVSIPGIGALQGDVNDVSYTFQWLGANALAILVRSLFVLVGAVLCFLLLYAVARKNDLAPSPQQAAQAAQMVALAA